MQLRRRATYWADRRRENGHTEPYKAPWWGLGNEMLRALAGGGAVG